MRFCEVIFTGKDGAQHVETTHADSLFEAADDAIRNVSSFWWWEPKKPIIVRLLGPEKEYRVTAQQVREWKAKRTTSPGSPL